MEKHHRAEMHNIIPERDPADRGVFLMGGGQQMNIIEKSVGELMPYENNPRKNDDAVEAVANSIKEFGFKVPIIIDADNVIVAGHTRLKAAQMLGLNTVPCVVADDLSEEQIRAFRLADNKVAEIADWDFALMAEELTDITDSGWLRLNANAT